MFAIVGGTGLDSLSCAQVNRRHNITSKYGPTSDAVLELEFEGSSFFFLPRHAQGHRLAPHRINYRANIWALQKLGVEQILAVNAVGGIHPDFSTGDLVAPHQIIDYTYGREATFFDGVAEPLRHADFSDPFSSVLRSAIISEASAGRKTGARTLHDFGVYACTQGPRLETAAEIQRLKRDGCDLVGMTAMPEAVLARELGMDYAPICMVVNAAAGLDEKPLSEQEIVRESANMAQDASDILVRVILADEQVDNDQ